MNAIRVLAATAAVTLRGFLRDRSVLAALILTVLAPALGAALSAASVGSRERLTEDLGWAAAGMLGWLLALAHGSGLADRGGVLGAFALSRPVSPSLLLAGRFLGLLAGLSAYAALGTGVLALWLFWPVGTASPALFGTGWLLLLRLAVVLALGLLFFTVLRPAAAAPGAAAVAAAGWLPIPEAPAPAALARLAAPDLRALEPPLAGLSPEFPETLAALAWPTLYAALYAGGTVTLALSVFPALAGRSGGVR